MAKRIQKQTIDDDEWIEILNCGPMIEANALKSCNAIH
jgi:hypothetical protein